MSISFPTSLDVLTNPSATDDTKTVSHSSQHSNANDAIEALEAKVGINGSSVATSLDKRVTDLEATGTGDVNGPASSVDNNIATFDLTTGKIIQDSGTNISAVTANTAKLTADTANVTAAGALMDSELTSITDVKALDQSVVSGATPTFGNDNFTEATNKNYVTDAEKTVIGNTSGTNTGDEVAATSTEINTGTDTTKYMPIDQFVASNRNIRYIDWRVLDSATDQTVATSIGGDFEFPFTGTIVSIGAYFDTAGTTGTATVDVNLGGTTIMTTNKISVETGEKSSRTATTQPTITTTSITAGDILTIDQDAIQTGTAGKGLVVRIGVRLS